MELKKGMYVRDEDYGIGKVTDICECDKCKERGFYEPIITYANHTEYVSSYNYMQAYEGKANNNIIDLIDVGDYVNGKLVVKKSKEYIDVYANNVDVIWFEDNRTLWLESNIKSIVTKEQFASMEYKVED